MNMNIIIYTYIRYPSARKYISAILAHIYRYPRPRTQKYVANSAIPAHDAHVSI